MSTEIRLRKVKMIVVPQWMTSLAKQAGYSDRCILNTYHGVEDRLGLLSDVDRVAWHQANTFEVFKSIINVDAHNTSMLNALRKLLEDGVVVNIPESELALNDIGDEVERSLCLTSYSMMSNVHRLDDKDAKLLLADNINSLVGYTVAYNREQQTILCYVSNKTDGTVDDEFLAPTNKLSVLVDRIKRLLYEQHWGGGIHALSSVDLLNNF